MRAFVGICLLSLCSGVALAADLKNFDKKGYTFKVKDGGVISTRRISGGASMYGLCTPGASCTITLKGRSVDFNSNSRLKIQGGKVSLD